MFDASTLRSNGRALLLACAAALHGCAGSGQACRKDPITGSERCQPASGDYGEAAATAAAATVAWGAVGCTVNQCEPPFRCNPDTKLCERIRCSEGSSACPPGYACDPVQQVCK